MEGFRHFPLMLPVSTYLVFAFGAYIAAGINVCGNIEKIPCDNSECIFRDVWCDRNVDCEDRSDEMYCRTHGWFGEIDNHCVEGKHFTCENGKCIPAAASCDGIDDCWDSSDEEEAYCENVTTTTTTEEWHRQELKTQDYYEPRKSHPPTRYLPVTAATPIHRNPWLTTTTAATLFFRSTRPTITTAATTHHRNINRLTTTTAATTVTEFPIITSKNELGKTNETTERNCLTLLDVILARTHDFSLQTKKDEHNLTMINKIEENNLRMEHKRKEYAFKKKEFLTMFIKRQDQIRKDKEEEHELIMQNIKEEHELVMQNIREEHKLALQEAKIPPLI